MKNFRTWLIVALCGTLGALPACVKPNMSAPYNNGVAPDPDRVWVQGHWTDGGATWEPGHWEARRRADSKAESGEDSAQDQPAAPESGESPQGI